MCSRLLRWLDATRSSVYSIALAPLHVFARPRPEADIGLSFSRYLEGNSATHSNGNYCRKFLQSADKPLAVAFTRFTNCRTTAEASPRREARLRMAFGWPAPLRRRYMTPSMRICCSEAGTTAMPSPLATRLSADVMRGASWPMRGLKPAARHAITVASWRPLPAGP